MLIKRHGSKLMLGLMLCTGCFVTTTLLNMMFIGTNTNPTTKNVLLYLEAIVKGTRGQMNQQDELQTISLNNEERNKMQLLVKGLQENKQKLQEQRIEIENLKEIHKQDEKRFEIKEEELKRKILRDTEELNYSVQAKLSNLHSKEQTTKVDSALATLKIQLSAMMIDAEKLSGLNQSWREKEMLHLQLLIQKRLHYLQNPSNCTNARQLVCEIYNNCGFGCQFHHLVYCFMVAYGTQRTLIIESKDWQYNQHGWEAVFMPVSELCRNASGPVTVWKGEKDDEKTQVVKLPRTEYLEKPPSYLPLGIPEEHASKLLRLHGNPSVWWIGQFVSYLFRLQPWLQSDLKAFKNSIGFQHPIVGIHVRRTDKIRTEATFHSIEEYMRHVIFWYDKYDLRLSMEKPGKKATRRVYVASDDPSVLPEARRKYPEIVFVGNISIAESAGTSNRYSQSGLRGVITDVYLLSKCDFLSCAFSSTMCRVAYELMQTLHPDASSYFHSLDDIYYYTGKTADHEQVAVMDHDTLSDSEEIDMKVGDVIGIAGNHWNGYSKGTNKRTGKVGLYPSYKVKEIFKSIKYPTYLNAEGK